MRVMEKQTKEIQEYINDIREGISETVGNK